MAATTTTSSSSLPPAAPLNLSSISDAKSTSCSACARRSRNWELAVRAVDARYQQLLQEQQLEQVEKAVDLVYQDLSAQTSAWPLTLAYELDPKSRQMDRLPGIQFNEAFISLVEHRIRTELSSSFSDSSSSSFSSSSSKMRFQSRIDISYDPEDLPAPPLSLFKNDASNNSTIHLPVLAGQPVVLPSRVLWLLTFSLVKQSISKSP